MSNLIPEPRVNKHGVSVIKHVRAEAKSKHTSFLSQVVPAISGSLKRQRDSLLADLHSDLTLEAQKTEDAAQKKADDEKRRYDDRHNLPEIEREFVEQIYQRELINRTRIRVQREFDQAIGKEETHIIGLDKLSTKTIGMIHEAFHGTGKVTDFLKQQDLDNEDRVRTAVLFREVSGSYDFGKVLRHVRISLDVKSLAGIEEGTSEHDAVSAVFRVAIGAANRRGKAQRESRHGTDVVSARLAQLEYKQWFEEELGRVQMSPQLAGVALEYPDRVEDILDYMERQNVDPADVDEEHLRLHLDNPSPALAEGIL